MFVKKETPPCFPQAPTAGPRSLSEQNNAFNTLALQVVLTTATGLLQASLGCSTTFLGYSLKSLPS